MTRMTPAKFVAEMQNAPGGEGATSLPTEGARPTPTSKETVMPHDTPRRQWPDDVIETIAKRNKLDATEAREILNGFAEALKRAEGGAS